MSTGLEVRSVSPKILLHMTLGVLHTVESLKPQAGSVAICLDGLCTALRERDIDPVIAAPGLNGRVVATPPAEAGASLSEELATLVARADVIHIHGWGGSFNRRVASAARAAGKPFVVSPLGSLSQASQTATSWTDRFRAWLGDRRMIRRASAITAMNDAEKSELDVDYSHKRVMRLPYGLNMAVRDPGTRQPNTIDVSNGRSDRRRLLVLAPVHPEEGFIPLLKALSELGKVAEVWDVVIAGEEVGDWRKQLQAAIRRKGGEDRVSFVDAPDDVSQWTLLNQAHLLVAPSLRPRCCVAVLQAIAAGVPVLATQCVAPTTRRDVLRACAPTRGDMKLALREMLALGDDGLADLGTRAREVGRALFDWSVLADEYVTLYQESACRAVR